MKNILRQEWGGDTLLPIESFGVYGLLVELKLAAELSLPLQKSANEITSQLRSHWNDAVQDRR